MFTNISLWFIAYKKKTQKKEKSICLKLEKKILPSVTLNFEE